MKHFIVGSCLALFAFASCGVGVVEGEDGVGLSEEGTELPVDDGAQAEQEVASPTYVGRLGGYLTYCNGRNVAPCAGFQTREATCLVRNVWCKCSQKRKGAVKKGPLRFVASTSWAPVGVTTCP